MLVLDALPCHELLMQPTQIQMLSTSLSSPSFMGFKASCHVLHNISLEGVCITYHTHTTLAVYTDPPLVYLHVRCYLLNACRFELAWVLHRF